MKHYILLNEDKDIIVEGTDLNKIYGLYNESQGDSIYMKIT